MKKSAIYTFRLTSGEQIIGEAINVSSALETGVLIVERPVMLDWFANEMMEYSEDDVEPSFEGILMAADPLAEVSFLTRNLVTLPVLVAPTYADAYREHVGSYRSTT